MLMKGDRLRYFTESKDKASYGEPGTSAGESNQPNGPHGPDAHPDKPEPSNRPVS